MSAFDVIRTATFLTILVGLIGFVGWALWDLVAYHRGWGKYQRKGFQPK